MKKLFSLIFLAAVILCSCQFPSNETTYSMDGAIQKGPFQLGSGVTIQEVDKNLDPTGRMYTTTTKDDLGSFSLASKFSSQYVEVTSKGFYFNECTNSTASAEISLRSYGDLSLNKPLNLNVLTTIAHSRIKILVDSGKEFAEARNQAESELLELLGFSAVSNLHFYEFSLASEGNDAALLLAVSATLQQGRSVAQLSQFIADLEQDFADDGTISNSELITKLRTSAAALNVSAIMNNIRTHYQSRGKTLEVPDFTSYRNILMIAGSVIGKPVFSLVQGTYIEEQAVTITAPAGAEIRYTIDESTPTIDSALYLNPVPISMNSNITLKAVSVLNGVVSSVTSARYIVKEGRYGADYFMTTPGKYIEYDFSGYSSVSDSIPVLCKAYSVFQKGNGDNPYNISLSLNINKTCYAFISASSNGYIFGSDRGASLGATPYLAWEYHRLQLLPEKIIFNQQFASDTSITYTPAHLSSWKSFSDIIQIDFDSTSFVSGFSTSVDNELRGTGKLIYAKGIGLIYFEITHSGAGTNPIGKKEILEYANQGDAPEVTFTGTYNYSGLAAIGHTVGPVGAIGMLNLIPPESYTTLESDDSFEFKQYALPGSYVTFFKLGLSSADRHGFRVCIPSSPTVVNLGEIGAIPDWGLATVY